MKKRCLYCYEELEEPTHDFHEACSKKFFDKKLPPDFPYTELQVRELAVKAIQSQISVTGVQAKLSLDVAKQEKKDSPAKFTIVGLWGGYILKLPSSTYPQLPELEDTTMHLADLCQIQTVPHTLFRLQSGKLAYVTKRIDRTKKGKLHMEDMCQLTERLTEHKYRGSYEQIGKAIVKYSSHPGLDIVNFFEQVIFSFLTGNADMHLKNFSLLNKPEGGYSLSPAYDMVATALVVKGDEEELALTLNGKKKKLKRKDFILAMDHFKMDPKVKDILFKKFQSVIPSWFDFIEISFLENEMKFQYTELIKERMDQLQLINQ
jgi:serine/threonine-protein kinase HipA